MNARTERKEFSWKRLLLPMAAGAVTGFAVVRFGHRYVEAMLELVGGDRIAGAAVGFVCLAVAAASFFATFFPSSVARTYDIAPGEDVGEEIALLRWSALAALFYGLFMLALSLSALVATSAAAVLMAVSLAGAVVTNAYLWRRYDELWREITAQASVMTFTVFHYILLAWAALAVLLDGAGFGPVNVVSALLGIFTIASVRATARRGMVHMP